MTTDPDTHSWFYWESGLWQPAENMAVDEAMLEAATQSPGPIVRFYGWASPAATFGYSQRYADVAAMTAVRPLIRRPTGGGLVSHVSDWTYSLVIPAQHAWHRIRAEESYQRIHAWVAESLAAMAMSVQFVSEPSSSLPGSCFASPEKSDLMFRGRKVAGAAQKRNRHGLLIQGSIQQLPGLPERALWHQAMLRAAERAWSIQWHPWSPSESLLRHAENLAREKYGAASFCQRR